MNARKMMIAAAVFAAAGSAFAATDVTGTFGDFTNIPSTKTRAEVVADMNQGHAQNQVAATETEYAEPARGFTSSKTRAEVVAELRDAAARGQLASTEWVEPTTMVAGTHRSREEVRAEAVQSAKK